MFIGRSVLFLFAALSMMSTGARMCRNSKEIFFASIARKRPSFRLTMTIERRRGNEMA